jgi:hypothetical protein
VATEQCEIMLLGTIMRYAPRPERRHFKPCESVKAAGQGIGGAVCRHKGTLVTEHLAKIQILSRQLQRYLRPASTGFDDLLRSLTPSFHHDAVPFSLILHL